MTGESLVAIDVLVCASVIVLAGLAVTAAHALASILLFMAMGTVMSVAWVRMGAPDLAIAEAVLGAGISGTLMIAAWASSPRAEDGAVSGHRLRQCLAALAGVAVSGAALVGLWPLLDGAAGLATPVADNLAATGVTHAVTAVLVDYRSFDTLLEVAVLLASLVAVWRLGLRRSPFPNDRIDALVTYSRWVSPAIVILAGALLWRGAFAPGGAFQAGAVAAVALILGSLLGSFPRWRPAFLRALACLGVAGFVAAGALAMLVTGTFLDWPDRLAAAAILFVELAAAVAIGFTLALLVLGVEPRGAAAGSPAPLGQDAP